jgi:hypothetical protein
MPIKNQKEIGMTGFHLCFPRKTPQPQSQSFLIREESDLKSLSEIAKMMK